MCIKMLCMNVLDKIAKMQKERGMSTYELAKQAGITQSTLSNMFTRKTCPTIDTLELICEAFGISLSEFFAEQEGPVYLSSSEKDLISKFRTLSDKEKNAVNNLIKSL